MKPIYCLLFVLLSGLAQGQKLVKGVVIDAEKGVPIPAASVFLSNTSVGTTADAKGAFVLSLPAGRFDLIVTSIGYDTYNQTLVSATAPDVLTIRLQPKAKELETVVVAPFEKDGWAKWGTFFLENFIGTSAQAQDGKIKNWDVIRFRHSRQTNELTAHASEPLIIENKALGYILRYDLEQFSYNFKTRFLFYQGYPFFEPMKGSVGRQRRWASERKEVYEGSMLHFMRSLYRNTLLQEGFEVRRLQKIPNTEKQRVKEAYKNSIRTGPDGARLAAGSPAAKDSSDYYNTILRQPDFFDKIGAQILPGDSIAYALDPTTAALDFEHYLLVIYRNQLAPLEYQQQYREAGSSMHSHITLVNGNLVEVQANGSYYHPAELLSSGYWGWSEKLATMLPFDYTAPSRQANSPK